MSKVYVIVETDYIDYEHHHNVIGAYSSRELAEEVKDAFKKKYLDWAMEDAKEEFPDYDFSELPYNKSFYIKELELNS